MNLIESVRLNGSELSDLSETIICRGVLLRLCALVWIKCKTRSKASKPGLTSLSSTNFLPSSSWPSQLVLNESVDEQMGLLLFGDKCAELQVSSKSKGLNEVCCLGNQALEHFAFGSEVPCRPRFWQKADKGLTQSLVRVRLYR